MYDFLSSAYEYKLFKLSKGKDAVSKLKPVLTQRDLPTHDNLFCFRPNHLSEVPSDLFDNGTDSTRVAAGEFSVQLDGQWYGNK